MGSSQSVRVVIFGSEYSIRGDVDNETTKKVAQYVHDKMVSIHDATSSRDDVKIAVLSALNIAGELFEARARYEEEIRKLQQIQNRVSLLEKKLEQGLDT